MTAINTIRQSHAVHILSDGAFCNDQGTILEIGPNVFPLPHLSAAVALRGATHFLPFLVYRLCRDCTSFEELLSKVVRTALEVYASFPMMLGTLGFGNVTPDFDLVVAGWSAKRNRPESYIVAAPRQQPQATPPWSLIDLPEILIAPSITELQIHAAQWSVPKSAEAFNPAEDGLKLLQAQRARRPTLNVEPKPHYVGGFIQLTTISDAGVDTKILHRWPDKVGERLPL
jgi:hypothetical protein